MSKKNVGSKVPIYKLKTSKEILNYYRDWTENNKYNQDMIDWNYTAPKETVDLLTKHVLDKKVEILDAGCGTGLVGIELKKHNYSNINGVDFSQNMLNLVPKNIYKSINKIDLNKPLEYKNNKFDVIVCVGTFTYGHVRAHALNEFIRIIKNKGLICFTINEGIYQEYDFDKKIKELTNSKSWNIKEFFKSNYIVNKDVNAWLCLAEIVK